MNNKTLKKISVDEYSKIIMNKFFEHGDSMKKALILGNYIPGPTSKDTSIEDINKFIDAARNVAFSNKLTEEEKKKFSVIMAEIINPIKVIYKHLDINQNLLKNMGFLNLGMQVQLQLLAIFVQNQARFLSKKKQSDGIVGIDSEISKYETTTNPKIRVSEADNLENNIDIIDSIIRYIYFINKNKSITFDSTISLEAEKIRSDDMIELINLSNNRNLLINQWDKIMYLNWSLFEDTENDLIMFSPQNRKREFVNRIGICRERHYLNTLMFDIDDRVLKLLSKTRYSIIESSKKIDITDANSIFSIEKKDFERSRVYIKRSMEVQCNKIKEYYNNARKNDICFNDLMDVMEYLLTIGFMYEDAIDAQFDENNNKMLKNLVPIVKTSKIVEHYSFIYNREIELSSRVIEEFVFKIGSKGDIHTQPLLSIDSEHVMIIPVVIKKSNFSRTLETILTNWEYDFSSKGLKYEEELKFKIDLCEHIEASSVPLTFKAYDGDVEFDFLGLLDDYLIIIEFKNTKRPYTFKERYNAEKHILNGVKQANRREEIILNDWDNVCKNCDLDLPKMPPSSNKIIKIVCTNILNFTSLTYDGVSIIDSTSLCKFFNDPVLELTSTLKGNIKKNILDIWDEGKPTAVKLKEYIKNPSTVKLYNDSFDTSYNNIDNYSSDGSKLKFEVLSLIEDPYRVELNNMTNKVIDNKTKIGRNDECPCGSKKKYKKCCL